MTTLQYLTVQDVIWINNRITGRENEFDFMKLEEGAFYQYSYGAAQGALPQASRLVAGLIKNQPFSDGNEGTALVAALVFLAINGFDVMVENIQALARHCGNAETALAALEALAKPSTGHDHATVVEAAESIILANGDDLRSLSPATA